MKENLPYKLPKESGAIIVTLCNVLCVPNTFLLKLGTDAENILCGVILYRHLGNLEKQDVMKMIYKLKDKSLASTLVTKVTDVILNPNWGLWSLTNKELQTKEEFHSLVKKWTSIVGFGATVSSTKELLSKAWRQKRYVTGANILTLLVWGGLLYSNKILTDVNLEQERRKIQILTKYH